MLAKILKISSAVTSQATTSQLKFYQSCGQKITNKLLFYASFTRPLVETTHIHRLLHLG